MWVKLANKSFIISTLTMVVLMAAGIAFGAWQANKTDTMSVVVTTQQAQQVGERAGALAGAANDHSELSVRHADSDDQARSEVTAGDADAWLHSRCV